MKAIAIKRLNRRVGAPSLNAQVIQPLQVGASIEIAETLNGDKIDGNRTWYKTSDGYYVWSGGVQVSLDAEIETETASSAMEWNFQKLIQDIPPQLFNNNGSNTKVAVLDSGFNLNHPDLQHLKNKAIIKDYGRNGNTNDLIGHGTHVTGLIFAKTARPDGVRGLVPEANAYLYKVYMDGIGFIDDFVESAIADCIEEGVQIINMSFSIPSSDNSQLHTIIQKALDKNIIVVASAGENEDLIQKDLVYPAQFNKVVSVGESENDFIKALHKPFNQELDFILPFIEQRSCWINDSYGLYRLLKGSSMATALITGIISAIMSSGVELDPLLALKNNTKNIASVSFNEKIQIAKP
jgi:subtilisin family serine protease